ncbi:acyltransferase [Lachnospiraceae bacterium HCP28S3_F9]
MMKWKEINVIKYLYFNYFCKNIVRKNNGKIIPYKNVILDLEKNSRIYIENGSVEIGANKLRNSKAETYIRLRENAVWKIQEGCEISYGSTIEILRNAVLSSQYFTMNSNSTIIVAEKIELGQDVMIGRNVVIYDSDYHQILDEEGKVTNLPDPVVIEDHVWIATNVLVLKGVTIGEGSIVGANTTVNKNTGKHVKLGTEYKMLKKENYGNWNRKNPRDE